MHPHHKKVISFLENKIRQDDRYRALIINGSLGQGTARANSDVDAILVATDKEFSRRRKLKNYRDMIFDLKDLSYPGGYVDAIVVSHQHLIDLAKRGSEPARAAYKGAFVAYSNIPRLQALIDKIPVYPKKEKSARIRSFSCQLACAWYYIQSAENRKDHFLMTHSIARLILSAGRLILAHNEILFPSYRSMMPAIRKARVKPKGFEQMVEDLTKSPSLEAAKVFIEKMGKYCDTDNRDVWSICIEDIYWEWWEKGISLDNC